MVLLLETVALELPCLLLAHQLHTLAVEVVVDKFHLQVLVVQAVAVQVQLATLVQQQEL
jgi:hypothetical protein